MKYIVCMLFSFMTLTGFGQRPKRMIKKLGNDPVFFIDSVSVPKSDLQNYQPKEIAAVSVYTDSDAIKLVGPEGKDGAVYIETIAFAKNKYWNYFKSKSPEYSKIITSPESDTVIQYVLNNRVLKTNFEGDLALIDDSIFKDITVIDQQTLQKEYGVTDKAYGVIIKSDMPKNLYHKKKHF